MRPPVRVNSRGQERQGECLEDRSAKSFNGGVLLNLFGAIVDKCNLSADMMVLEEARLLLFSWVYL